MFVRQGTLVVDSAGTFSPVNRLDEALNPRYLIMPSVSADSFKSFKTSRSSLWSEALRINRVAITI